MAIAWWLKQQMVILQVIGSNPIRLCVFFLVIFPYLLTFFAQSVSIKLASPQAAQLCIHFQENN